MKKHAPARGEEKAACLRCFAFSAATVIDAAPPVITLGGANALAVQCHTVFTDPGLATDNSYPNHLIEQNARRIWQSRESALALVNLD